MYKAILFDFDGTIVDTLELYVKAYDVTLQKLGINYTKEEIIKNCFGKTEFENARDLEIPEKSQEFQDSYFNAIREVFENITLFSGSLEFLKQEKGKGTKLGLITFAHRWYIDRMLEKIQIKELFDAVISFNDVKKAKPDPEAVFKICKILNVDTHEAIVIGDSKSDILMGNSADTRTILFYPKEHLTIHDLQKLLSSNPTFVAHSYKELGNIL